MTIRFTIIPAVHLFLIKDNQILLLRRFNTGYEDGNYSVPAGHLDGNEPAKIAMCREAKEEANLIIKPANLKLIHLMHRKKLTEERIDFFFTVPTWQGQPQIMEPHKCDDLSWFSIKKLPLNMVPYVHFAVKEYLKDSPYSEYGWKGEP